MPEFRKIDDVLDFAISKEKTAVEFYTEKAEKATRKHVKEMFLEIAREERRHEKRLIEIKESKSFNISDLTEASFYIDCVEDFISNDDNMSYEEALMLAMKREKESYALYTELAAQVRNADVKTILLALAQEEAGHKLQIELEYDKNIHYEH